MYEKVWIYLRVIMFERFLHLGKASRNYILKSKNKKNCLTEYFTFLSLFILGSTAPNPGVKSQLDVAIAQT